MSRKKDLHEYARRMLPSGFYLAEHSPGDGKTRYAIVFGKDDYFGGYEVCTALGLREAEVMVRAFVAGADHRYTARSHAPTPSVGEGKLATYEVVFSQEAVIRWVVEFKAPASLTDEEVEAIGEAIYYGAVQAGTPEKLAAIARVLLEQGAKPIERETEGFETYCGGVFRR